jgi:tryptophan-rich sensory protein
MRVRAVFLLCLAILFALTPLMLPSFDGYDPEDFPVQVLQPSVQPAGYAFSIWLVIYAGLILHAGFGLLRRADDPVWDRPRLPLMAALVLGISWVALAEDQPVAATLVILIMLVAALMAVMRTGRGDRWLLMPPVALTAGWVTPGVLFLVLAQPRGGVELRSRGTGSDRPDRARTSGSACPACRSGRASR